MNEGKKYTLITLGFCMVILVVRLIAAAQYADSNERIMGSMAGTLGLIVICCPIAYAIGNFIGKSK